MNSLVSYESDDDFDDSPEERSMDSYGTSRRNYRKTPPVQHDDTNYDEVQMSCSEDSDAETKSPQKHNRDRDDVRRSSPKGSRDAAKDSTSQRDRRDDRYDRDRYSGRERNEERSRHRDDDRPKNRDDKDDKNKSRDDDRTRDRGDRYRDDDKTRDRKDDRRDRYSTRDDRYRGDRDRKRSRSPRDSRDRDRRRSRSPRRSRSRSRDRNTRGGFQRRFDRGNRMDKFAADQRANQQDPQQNDESQKDRFFMPGITGRFRDQIEKRKLLWQKKETEAAPAGAVAPTTSIQTLTAPRATKVWEATTFAQDTDGKVANKFKRLMGIKTPTDGNKSASEVLKKQDEMFSAMEQQYEVARTTTHTMRGVGLGFSSYNR